MAEQYSMDTEFTTEEEEVVTQSDKGVSSFRG